MLVRVHLPKMWHSYSEYWSIDHAVSASTVYLIRSLGSVWGVALTAAITQNTLSSKLPRALEGIPNKEEVRTLVIMQRKMLLTLF